VRKNQSYLNTITEAAMRTKNIPFVWSKSSRSRHETKKKPQPPQLPCRNGSEKRRSAQRRSENRFGASSYWRPPRRCCNWHVASPSSNGWSSFRPLT
jgi:hypothetical protein